MRSKEYNLKHVAPASSRWISVSAFRRFDVSAFQRFGVCAAIAMLGINTGYAQHAAAQDVKAESVFIDEEALADDLKLDWFDLQPLDLPQDLPARFDTKVTFIEDELTLSLQRFSVRKDGFRLLVQDETGQIKEVEAPPPHTYRGTVLEIDGSEVAASLIDGQLSAVILLPDGRLWGVQPVSEVTAGAPPSWHVVYDWADVQPGPWTCGNDDSMRVTEVHGTEGEDDNTPWEGEGGPGAQAGERITDLAFDTDVEFFQLNGSSVRLTVLDIERIVNGGAVIYRRDVGIDYWIHTVIVRTAEPDPYFRWEANGLLCQFRSEWNANQRGIPRDTAHLMTGKDILGNTIGLAYIGVICNVNGSDPRCQPKDGNVAYGFSQSRFSNNFAARVALTAHEIGHNWSARHCDGDRDCNIMCSGIGDCSGNVTSFGSRSRTSILIHRALRGCLTTCVGVANVPGNANTVIGGIRVACWGGQVAISAGSYPEIWRVNKKVKLTSKGGIVRIGK